MKVRPHIGVLIGVSAALTVLLSTWANALIVDVLRASAPVARESAARPAVAGSLIADASWAVPEMSVPIVTLLVVGLALAAAVLLRRQRPGVCAALCFIVAAAQLFYGLHVRDMASATVWVVTDGMARLATDTATFDLGHSRLGIVALALLVPFALSVSAGVLALRSRTAEPAVVSSPRVPLATR